MFIWYEENLPYIFILHIHEFTKIPSLHNHEVLDICSALRIMLSKDSQECYDRTEP